MKNHILFILAQCLWTITMVTQAQPRKPVEWQTYPRFMDDALATPRGMAPGLLRRSFNMKAEDEMVWVSTWQDELGITHDRYQQYYQKVKVEGAQYTVHSRNGRVTSLSGEFKGLTGLKPAPALTAFQAFQLALQQVKAKTYAWEESVRQGFPDYRKPQGELVIIGGSEGDRFGPSLAWKFDIYAAEPLYRADVYIDAQKGTLLFENHRIHTEDAPASGATLYNGTRSFTADNTGTGYRLRQASSGGGIETYTMNNGTAYAAAADITSATATFTADTAANQAHWGAEQTYAYFKEKHNRNSYNNAGAAIKSYVHFNVNYVNAFWDGSRMTYGDGNLTQGYKPLVSLDICGHEISHGVTQFSANLNYSSESGALNESFSDIFGEAVEYYAQGSNDWLMGCDIGVNKCGAFRSMANPNAYADPDTYKGNFWFSSSADNYGVHTNSGVQNKWFYILVNGESGINDLGNSYAVAGIGWDKAARIAYRNLTTYLTATSNYVNARTGAIQAATDLFGAGSPEVIATTNAWYAVGVGCEYASICYCSSSAVSQNDEWIASVTIGGFTNTSGGNPYQYYANKPVNLISGTSYSIRLTPGFLATKYPEYWRIWIDYNLDNDFEDAGELAFDAGSAIDSARTGTLVIPASASGSTRMRISMKYASAAQPCELFQWGEVEDYPVNFSSTPPDTLPPAASVLSATSKTTSQIMLSWTAATDNVGVTGYDLWVNGSKVNSTLLTARTYTLSGLTPATPYSIYVVARDQVGNSTASNILNVSTDPLDLLPPSSPVLSANATSQHSIDLSWTASTDNVGIAGYDVFLEGVKHNTAAISGLTYTINGLNPFTTYSIYITARDTSGNRTNSNTVSVTTPDTQAPSAPVLSSPLKTQSSIDLSWTASADNVGVAGYDVFVDGAKHNTSNITGVTYTVGGLNALTTYYLYVVARDASGNTTNSNVVSVTTPDTQAPSAPVLSSPLKSQFGIDLNWTAATDNVGVGGYDVFVDGVKNNTANITGLSYSVAGLKAWTVYQLYVVARDGSGNTTVSNTLSVRTADTQAPSAPVLSSPSKTQTTISLSWSAATDNGTLAGYDVYVGGVKHNSSLISSLSYTVNGLSAGTSYSIYVRALDEAGNATNSNTLTIATASSISETVVSEYFFPSTLDSWTPSSASNCLWSNTATLAWEGSGSMLIQSRNTTATSPALPLSAYSQVEIRFYFRPVSMENGERLLLGYNNGSGNTYTTVGTFTAASVASGTNFTNNNFYLATVTLNSSPFGSGARFRFTIGGNDVSDKIYIDAISVRGRAGTTGTGTTVTLSTVVKPVAGASYPGALLGHTIAEAGDQPVVMQLYPNPAASTLRFSSPVPIRWLRIRTLDGKLQRTVRLSDSYGYSLDVSFLRPGMYIAELVLEDRTVLRKFIKE